MRSWRRGWEQTPTWQPTAGFLPNRQVTVLLPARNEAANIRPCLESLLKQNYPPSLLEILVLDDFSEDETPQIVQALENQQLRLLKMADFPPSNTISYKKRALEVGIQQAQGSLILCTDADTVLPSTWVSTIVHFFEVKKPLLVAAPVLLRGRAKAFEQFQVLDLLGMMGITAAGISGRYMHLANGANLAFEKEAFEQIEGYRQFEQVASGDDVFLIQKMARAFPGRIDFLKSKLAAVETDVAPGLRAFWQQRLRWATKARFYKERTMTAALGYVWLFTVALCWWTLAAPWAGQGVLWSCLGMWAIKALADYQLLRSTAIFFEKKEALRWFLPALILHTAYIATVGLAGNLQKKYRWKGRRVQ